MKPKGSILYLKPLMLKTKRLIDIGANTGFFTFELLDSGASTAICFEGNKNHADFIIESSKLLNQEGRIVVKMNMLTLSPA